MRSDAGLDDLWASARPGSPVLSADLPAGLPPVARRYLEHAVAPATPLATAVRLSMRGTIKLRGWVPFVAEEVLHRGRGMVWRASTRLFGLPVTGFDRLIDGHGEMRWRVLGVLPLLAASGPDVALSAEGRARCESIWLPSLLLGDGVEWTPDGADGARATLHAFGGRSEIRLGFSSETGGIRTVRLRRWGDPDRRGFREEDFGGIVESEATFGGYTIPSRVRIGWYPDSARFEPEGEFFRATVEAAEFR